MSSTGFESDLLSDLFAGDALKTSVIAAFRLSAPWGLEVPHFGPALLYAVIEGSLEIASEGSALRRLGPGDVLLLPRGLSHQARSGGGAPVRHVLDVFRSVGVHAWQPGERLGAPIQLDLPGEGPTCQFIVVLLEFQDAAPNSLHMSLPDVIHLDRGQNQLGPWLQPAVQSIVDGLGQGRMGYFALSTKLAELVFIDTISTFLLLNREGASGWLRATSDARLARVLAKINRSPAEPWTIERMAGVAGMSRSSFAAAFRRLAGQTPFAYLTGVRMRLAARLIADGRSSVKAAAHDLGYASEKAFGAAFKKVVGQTPGALRPNTRPRGPADRF